MNEFWTQHKNDLRRTIVDGIRDYRTAEIEGLRGELTNTNAQNERLKGGMEALQQQCDRLLVLHTAQTTSSGSTAHELSAAVASTSATNRGSSEENSERHANVKNGKIECIDLIDDEDEPPQPDNDHIQLASSDHNATNSRMRQRIKVEPKEEDLTPEEANAVAVTVIEEVSTDVSDEARKVTVIEKYRKYSKI